MPLESLHDHDDAVWGLWKMAEDEDELASSLEGNEFVPENLHNRIKRLEYLTGRLLLKTLLEKWLIPYEGLIKDESGKPFFRKSPFHLSLSHSYPYVAAIVHKQKNVGIDLEQPKSKLFHIAHRVMNAEELADAGIDLEKHCIYWCAKETLIKIFGKRHLHLSKELAIRPFHKQKEGKLTGSIIAPEYQETFTLHYKVYDNFIVVLNL